MIDKNFPISDGHTRQGNSLVVEKKNIPEQNVNFRDLYWLEANFKKPTSENRGQKTWIYYTSYLPDLY